MSSRRPHHHLATFWYPCWWRADKPDKPDKRRQARVHRAHLAHGPYATVSSTSSAQCSTHAVSCSRFSGWCLPMEEPWSRASFGHSPVADGSHASASQFFSVLYLTLPVDETGILAPGFAPRAVAARMIESATRPALAFVRAAASRPAASIASSTIAEDAAASLAP